MLLRLTVLVWALVAGNLHAFAETTEPRVSVTPPHWSSDRTFLGNIKVVDLPAVQQPSEEQLVAVGLPPVCPVNWRAIAIERQPYGPGGPKVTSLTAVPSNLDLEKVHKQVGSEATLTEIGWKAFRFEFFRAAALMDVKSDKMGEALIVVVSTTLGAADFAADLAKLPVEKQSMYFNCAAVGYDLTKATIKAGLTIAATVAGGPITWEFAWVPSIRAIVLLGSFANGGYDCWDAVRKYETKAAEVREQQVDQQREEQRQAEERERRYREWVEMQKHNDAIRQNQTWGGGAYFQWPPPASSNWQAWCDPDPSLQQQATTKPTPSPTPTPTRVIP